MSLLLLALVVATFLSLRSALAKTLCSLTAAHEEQLESERRYRVIFDTCSDVIAVYPLEDDRETGKLIEVNQATCRALGHPRDKLLAMRAMDIVAPEARHDFIERLQALRGKDTLVLETTYVTSDGHRFPVEASMRATTLRGQRLCLSIARDISQRLEREEHWRSLSHVDELTGLLNRRGFAVMAEQAARRARRLGSRSALMYFDVDGLKVVNDLLGHSVGDQLLSATADVLRSTFRAEDVVARLGGDEFAALAVLERGDEQLGVLGLEARLESAIHGKRTELDGAFDLSLSHGSLLATPEELASMDELLVRCDELMYRAKQSRRARLVEDGEPRPGGVPPTDIRRNPRLDHRWEASA